jgi:hypothetical protein
MKHNDSKKSAKHIHNEIVSVRIPNMVKNKLYDIAEQNWCGVSDIIRRGIKQQLTLHNEEQIKLNQHRTREWGVS